MNNQRDSLKPSQKFDYNQNNIQLNFRLIDFQNQNILLRSRLSKDATWSYSSDRSIKFYSLKTGDYSLQIEYSIDNFHWHRAFVWDFTVLPPWWRTFYFQAGVLLIILLSGVGYFKRRIARVHERNNLFTAQQHRLIRAELDTQERERSRIAKDLHDSVGTNLTAIKMAVWSLLKKYDDAKASEIENQFRHTIHDIRGIIHDLVPSGLDFYGLTETVRDYTSKIEDNLGVQIEVNSFGPTVTNSSINLIAFRILQELLSNTLKHAQATKITIHISSFDELLSILYQDNGKGFDANAITKGWGLLNIQSRLHIAKGTLKFESGQFGVSYIIDIPLTLKEND